MYTYHFCQRNSGSIYAMLHSSKAGWLKKIELTDNITVGTSGDWSRPVFSVKIEDLLSEEALKDELDKYFLLGKYQERYLDVEEKNTNLSYKGFTMDHEYQPDTDNIFGCIQHKGKDFITYQTPYNNGDFQSTLENEFRNSVDDYLEFIEELENGTNQ